jgi:hypothetical protein
VISVRALVMMGATSRWLVTVTVTLAVCCPALSRWMNSYDEGPDKDSQARGQRIWHKRG